MLWQNVWFLVFILLFMCILDMKENKFISCICHRLIFVGVLFTNREHWTFVLFWFGTSQLCIPMTLLGIEPRSFRSWNGTYQTLITLQSNIDSVALIVKRSSQDVDVFRFDRYDKRPVQFSSVFYGIPNVINLWRIQPRNLTFLHKLPHQIQLRFYFIIYLCVQLCKNT